MGLQTQFSLKKPPPLGTWVRLAPEKRATRADRTAAQTAALITFIGDATCTVIYPNELVLRGFFKGSPLKRIEDVPLSRLRSVDDSQGQKLEKELRRAIAMCGKMALGQDRFANEHLSRQDEPTIQRAAATVEQPVIPALNASEDATRDRSRSPVPKRLGGAAIEPTESANDTCQVAHCQEASDRSRSPEPTQMPPDIELTPPRQERVAEETSESPPELTPQRQRQLRMLQRQLSDEKEGEEVPAPRAPPALEKTQGSESTTVSTPASVDKQVLPAAGAKLDRKRLMTFTRAVSQVLRKQSDMRMEIMELASVLTKGWEATQSDPENLSDAFSMPEVVSGLQTLDMQNKILLLDSLVMII